MIGCNMLRRLQFLLQPKPQRSLRREFPSMATKICSRLALRVESTARALRAQNGGPQSCLRPGAGDGGIFRRA